MFRFTTSERTGLTNPVVGRRAFVDLENGVQTHDVSVTIRGTLTIAVAAAAAILNGGSILAAFEEAGIFNGSDLQVWNPLVARFVSELLAPQPLSATRLTSTAIGAYDLVEQFTLPCAVPYALNPRETAMMELNIQSQLQAFVKRFNPDASKIATAGGGGGTVELSGIEVTVQQKFDGFEQALPYYQPRVTRIVEDITGTNKNKEIKISTDAALRGMIITERTSDVGLVSDILNAVSLVSTERNYIGPQKVSKDDWQRRTERWAGGDIYTPDTNASHTAIWFQEYGRLSNILQPGDTNLKLVVDVQPSASAGTSQLEITLIELVRDLRVGPNGRRIVSAEAPIL